MKKEYLPYEMINAALYFRKYELNVHYKDDEPALNNFIMILQEKGITAAGISIEELHKKLKYIFSIVDPEPLYVECPEWFAGVFPEYVDKNEELPFW